MHLCMWSLLLQYVCVWEEWWGFRLPWPLPHAVTQSGVLQCVGCERRLQRSALHECVHTDAWQNNLLLVINISFCRHLNCHVCAGVECQACHFGVIFNASFPGGRSAQCSCTTTAAVRCVGEVWWIFTTVCFRWCRPGCWEHQCGNTHFWLQSTWLNEAGKRKDLSG